MFRPLALAGACAALMATSAAAFDVENMSDAEREAFGAEIRKYILTNPEIVLEAVAIIEDRRAQEAAQAEIDMVVNNADALFNDEFSYVGGNPDGDITVVEFLDYRCGFCKRAFPAVEELVASDGNIRIIVKEYPILGEASIQASRFAIATLKTEGDDAYKEVHDRLMAGRTEPGDAVFRRLSEELDLDYDEIVAKMDSDEVSQIIEANYALARNLQIQGTPTFVFGDALVRGFVELDQMRAIVDDIRDSRG